MPRIFILALLLAGCSGTDTQVRMLEGQGVVRVDRSPSPGADYVVSIRSVADINYNMNNKQERETTALTMLRTQCNGSPRIIDEQVIETGTTLIGAPSRTYNIRVKCG